MGEPLAVLNTFALSKVYYAAHALTILPYHLGQLEADIWNFLWRDKNHLVRKTVCIAQVMSGGLTVPDLRSRLTAIRLQRLRRMFTDKTISTWQHFARHWFYPCGGIYRLGLAAFASENWTAQARFLANLPPFYRQLLKAWKQVSQDRQATAPSCYGQAEDELLWGNPLTGIYVLCILSVNGKSWFFTVRDLNVLPPPQRNTVSAFVYPRVLEAVPQCWNQLPREPEWETFRWMSELCLFKSNHEPIPLREATTRIIYIIDYETTFGVLQIVMTHGGNTIQLHHSPILRGNCYERYRLIAQSTLFSATASGN